MSLERLGFALTADKHQNIWKWAIKILIAVLIGIPLLITLVRYAAWKMVLYLIFWIIVPGAIVLRYVFRHRYESREMGLLAAFFIGAGLIFAEWFLLRPLRLRWPLLFINPFVDLLFLFVIICRKKERGRLMQVVRDCVDVKISFLITLLIAVWLCAYALNFSFPRAMDITTTDFTWQVGNIYQLAGKTPFNDIRVDGVTVRYHFFAKLFLAISQYIFGGEAWLYLAQYSIWYLPLLITTAFRGLYSRVTSDERAITVMSVATMVGFGFNSSYGSWQYSIFTDVNSVGMGISCLLLLFLNLAEGRKNGAFLLEQLLLLLVLSGIKGPFALLYVLTLLVWVPLCAIKRKKWDMKYIILAILSAFSFAIIFHFLLAAGTETYFSDMSNDDILYSTIRGSELKALYENMGKGRVGKRLLLLLPSLAASFTWLLPFAVWGLCDLCRCFFGRREWTEDNLFAAILAIGGLTAYYLFHVMGNSELYFLFAALPFMGYIGCHKICALLKMRQVGTVIGAVIFTIVFLQLCGSSFRGGETGNLLAKAKGYLLHTAEAVEPERLEEFDAYDFLRENTPTDALIATNWQGNGTFHCISAFAGRQCYLEGFEYSRRNFGFLEGELRQQQMWNLFGDEWDDGTKADFCRWTGIDYLVIFRGKNIPSQPPQDTSECFELVYGNDAVVVYRVCTS